MKRQNIIEWVRQAAANKVLFLPHAIRQMSRPDRMISVKEVKEIIKKGELIEDYPEDIRGHSCLIYGFSKVENRPIHIVCSPKSDYLAVITAYLPDSCDWTDGFKKRRQQ